jgi:hypothetical protein
MIRLFTIFILLISSITAFAGQITVVTGYGYIKDIKGNIIAKEELSPGTYPLTDGYYYIEVRDKSALNSITIHPPLLPAHNLNDCQPNNNGWCP